MDLMKLLTSASALIFVLCIIGLVSALFRKYGNGVNFSSKKSTGRLKIKETLNIDARKKIVLIGKDDKEYLVAFNDNDIEILDKENVKENN